MRVAVASNNRRSQTELWFAGLNVVRAGQSLCHLEMLLNHWLCFLSCRLHFRILPIGSLRLNLLQCGLVTLHHPGYVLQIEGQAPQVLQLSRER